MRQNREKPANHAKNYHEFEVQQPFYVAKKITFLVLWPGQPLVSQEQEAMPLVVRHLFCNLPIKCYPLVKKFALYLRQACILPFLWLRCNPLWRPQRKSIHPWSNKTTTTVYGLPFTRWKCTISESSSMGQGTNPNKKSKKQVLRETWGYLGITKPQNLKSLSKTLKTLLPICMPMPTPSRLQCPAQACLHVHPVSWSRTAAMQNTKPLPRKYLFF